MGFMKVYGSEVVWYYFVSCMGGVVHVKKVLGCVHCSIAGLRRLIPKKIMSGLSQG